VEATTSGGVGFRAYEIHMGVTERPELAPFAYLADGTTEGCRADGVVGTYLHGAFEEPAAALELLGLEIGAVDKDAMYDRLADWLVAHSRPAVLEALLA
jgi:adenosylcobyric acid synthase